MRESRSHAAADAKRAEVERKALADAQKIVAIWNARQAGGRPLWLLHDDRTLSGEPSEVNRLHPGNVHFIPTVWGFVLPDDLLEPTS
jgi:hypothetical protein